MSGQNWFGSKSASGKVTPRRRAHGRPAVENLEDRLTPTVLIVEPAGQAVGLNRYATLGQALAAAQNGDTIQIEPGANPGIGTVFQNNLTIQGDPVAGSRGLQAANTLIPNLVLIGNNDSVINVAVGTVSLGLGNTGESFNHDIFYNQGVIQTIGTGTSGLINGHDTIQGSTFINGANVTIGNAPNSVYDTASYDVISNNLFLNPVGFAIRANNETTGLTIADNRIYHNDPNTGTAFIQATDCTGIITGNVVQLQAALNSIGIFATDSSIADGSTTNLIISNNVVTTNQIGIAIQRASNINIFRVTVANNTLAGNLTGIALNGNQAGGAADFGIINITGNDFRGLNGNSGGYAIVASDSVTNYVQNTTSSSIIAARGNVFSTSNPQAAVSTLAAPGTTIDTGGSLVGNKASLTAMFATVGAGAPTSAQLTLYATSPATTLARVAVTSAQATSLFVAGLGTALLNRQLTAAEIAVWSHEISSGAMSEEQVVAYFVTSGEYYRGATQGASNPNGAWIQSLFLNLLGRQPSGTEMSAALTEVGTHGLFAFAMSLLSSAEFRADQVEAMFGQPPIGVLPTPNILKQAAPPLQSQINNLVNSHLDLLGIQQYLLETPQFTYSG
jgi:hypothetical protein